jgi:hypothetical protein
MTKRNTTHQPTETIHFSTDPITKVCTSTSVDAAGNTSVIEARLFTEEEKAALVQERVPPGRDDF